MGRTARSPRTLNFFAYPVHGPGNLGCSGILGSKLVVHKKLLHDENLKIFIIVVACPEIGACKKNPDVQPTRLHQVRPPPVQHQRWQGALAQGCYAKLKGMLEQPAFLLWRQCLELMEFRRASRTAIWANRLSQRSRLEYNTSSFMWTPGGSSYTGHRDCKSRLEKLPTITEQAITTPSDERPGRGAYPAVLYYFYLVRSTAPSLPKVNNRCQKDRK